VERVSNQNQSQNQNQNQNQTQKYRTAPTRRPDMVILEHDHTAQIVSMRVHAADHHAVLLHEPEPGRGFARAGDGAFPALCSGEVAEPAGATSDSEKRITGEPAGGHDEDLCRRTEDVG
jgi:hypothetical protein